MEKDIEILEKYIKDKTIKTMGALVTPDKEELQAIENLINRVKELENKNKVDEEALEELEHLLTSQLGFNIYRDYIPKSKIKDKIIKLEKTISEPMAKTDRQMSDLCAKIQVLIELLEEQE